MDNLTQNHQTFPLTPGNPPLPAPVRFRAIYDSNYCAESPSCPSDAPAFHPFRFPIPKVSCRVVIFEAQDNYSGCPPVISNGAPLRVLTGDGGNKSGSPEMPGIDGEWGSTLTIYELE
ncbi:hypothetical protein CDAR_23781 [Caerostris darwini]|uniref:Uncharacterized protein n=1 Tax=Caerostris darwini TaxID=1538125 RepID=A0AAV4TZP5_9ARAC|nr:hypothetical protein CDAR_23781 [Caerostris darwini]